MDEGAAEEHSPFVDEKLTSDIDRSENHENSLWKRFVGVFKKHGSQLNDAPTQPLMGDATRSYCTGGGSPTDDGSTYSTNI